MDNVLRATQSLIETYGSNAARVAMRRAMNAALGGSEESAHIWREIAAAIAERQRREKSAPERSVGLGSPAVLSVADDAHAARLS